MFDSIIVSTDIETNGPVAGIHSLWSIGAAAYKITKNGNQYSHTLISTFEINLSDDSDTMADEDTMEWWNKHSLAANHARKDTVDPKVAMQMYADWVTTLGDKAIFVAWPASLDSSFITYYSYKHLGRLPFYGHNPLDMRAYHFGASKGKDWKLASMHNLPKGLLPEYDRKHFALDDALTQGDMACKLITDNLST